MRWRREIELHPERGRAVFVIIRDAARAFEAEFFVQANGGMIVGTHAEIDRFEAPVAEE
jgi:hypothetical protein